MFKILRLQSSLEESHLNEKQLKHKLEIQTETLSNKMEELSALNERTQSSMTSEMIEVQIKILELENVKVGRLFWAIMFKVNILFYWKKEWLKVAFVILIYLGGVGTETSGISIPWAADATGQEHPPAAPGTSYRRKGGEREGGCFLVQCIRGRVTSI